MASINPTNGKGVMAWVMTGFFGGLIALMIGFFVPSLIPTQISSQKL